MSDDVARCAPEFKVHHIPHTYGCDGHEPSLLEQVLAYTGEIRITPATYAFPFHVCCGEDGVGPAGENWCRQDWDIDEAFRSILREGSR